MIVIYKNELYHHGIEGQKWGVRNGPPYPLDRDIKESVYQAKSSAKSALVAKNHIKKLQQERDKIRLNSRKRREIDNAISNENKTAWEESDNFFRELNDAELRLRSGNAGKTSMKSILEEPEILDFYEEMRRPFETDPDWWNANSVDDWVSSEVQWAIARSYSREMPDLNINEIARTINTGTNGSPDYGSALIEDSYRSIRRGHS